MSCITCACQSISQRRSWESSGVQKAIKIRAKENWRSEVSSTHEIVMHEFLLARQMNGICTRKSEALNDSKHNQNGTKVVKDTQFYNTQESKRTCQQSSHVLLQILFPLNTTAPKLLNTSFKGELRTLWLKVNFFTATKRSVRNRNQIMPVIIKFMKFRCSDKGIGNHSLQTCLDHTNIIRDMLSSPHVVVRDVTSEVVVKSAAVFQIGLNETFRDVFTILRPESLIY